MAQELTIRLLDSLAAKQERVTLPILKTSDRRRSGLRGLRRAALHGARDFYAERGALDKAMLGGCCLVTPFIRIRRSARRE